MTQRYRPYDWVKTTRFTVPHAQSADNNQPSFVPNCAVRKTNAHDFAGSYRRRWGIETTYPVIGGLLPTRSLDRLLGRAVLFPVCCHALQSVGVGESAAHGGVRTNDRYIADLRGGVRAANSTPVGVGSLQTWLRARISPWRTHWSESSVVKSGRFGRVDPEVMTCY